MNPRTLAAGVAPLVVAVDQAEPPQRRPCNLPFSVSPVIAGLVFVLLFGLQGWRWALLHGVILRKARAMGEFGAVGVVSGHVRGQTHTLPLHIEIVYDEYQFAAAFAVASLLAALALVTLVLKALVERHMDTGAQSAETA